VEILIYFLYAIKVFPLFIVLLHLALAFKDGVSISTLSTFFFFPEFSKDCLRHICSRKYLCEKER
jgi:hypothetical protein